MPGVAVANLFGHACELNVARDECIDLAFQVKDLLEAVKSLRKVLDNVPKNLRDERLPSERSLHLAMSYISILEGKEQDIHRSIQEIKERVACVQDAAESETYSDD